MAQAATPFTFPPGRMVWGSLYKGRDKDFEGKPLEYKTGADKGKPRIEFAFGVAFPKVVGQHWATSEWGKVLWQVGHSLVGNAGQLEDFSWKVTDGDSTKMGKRGRPCDKPGYAGHWVLAFSGSFAPRVVNGVSGKFEDLTQPDFVLPGDFIQVQGSVAPNNSQGNPGIYLNHGTVCFSGYSADGRITVGADPAQMGFATGTVAGAQAVPVGGAMPPAAAPAISNPPPPPGAVTPPAAPPVAPPSVAVTPNPAFTPPPPGGVPLPPGAAPVRVMLPGAGGTYDEFKAAGWTDEQLVQHGKMQA